MAHALIRQIELSKYRPQVYRKRISALRCVHPAWFVSNTISCKSQPSTYWTDLVRSKKKKETTSQMWGAISSALKERAKHGGAIDPPAHLISSQGNDVIFCHAVWRGVYLRGVGRCNGGGSQCTNLISCFDPKRCLKLLIYVHVPQVCERKSKRGKNI